MIETLYFGLGFLIYIGFCITTFETYSKKNETTKVLALFVFYMYYTLLAGYVINFVDYAESYSVVLFEIITYAISGALVCFFYYKFIIVEEDKKNGFDEETGYERNLM